MVLLIFRVDKSELFLMSWIKSTNPWLSFNSSIYITIDLRTMVHNSINDITTEQEPVYSSISSENNL